MIDPLRIKNEPQNPHVYQFGEFHIDRDERLLKRGEQTIHLPPKVIDLLLVLVESGGRVLSKDELMKAVWADAFVEETNLTHNISLLRRTFDEKSGGTKYIETIPRRGYRFVADVRRIDEEDDDFELIALERTDTQIVVEEETEAESERKLPGARAAGGGRRAFFMFAGLAVVILAAAGGFWFWGIKGGRISAKSFQISEIKRVTTNGNIVNAALAPDGKYFVYALAENAGQSLWVQRVSASQPIQIAPPAKVNYWGLAISPDGEFVYCSVFEANKADVQLKRVPVLGGLIETVPLGKSVDSTITFSPDGGQFAWTENCGDRSELRVADRDGSNNRLLAERRKPSLFSYESASSSWSPDGAMIAAASKDVDANGEFMSVVGVDAAAGTEKFLTSHRWAAVNHLAWLRSGAGLIVIAKKTFGSPAQIWELSYPGGEVRQLTNDLNSYEWLGMKNDSTAFLTVQQNAITRLLVAGENQSIETAPTITQQTGSHDQIGWTRAGQIAYFSFAGDETNVWLINADGSKPRQLTSGMHAFKGLAVSPDGKFIAFSAARAGTPNIWRVDTDGQNLKQLTSGDGEAFPTISPDGEWIVYQQGITSRVSLQKIPATGGESSRLTEVRGIRPQFSPDGKFVAFFFMDKAPSESEPQWRVAVVSVENGQLQKKLDLAPTIIERFLRWTPDGKAIAYISSEGDTSNIVFHPLDQPLAPHNFTNFQNGAGMIQAFAWSPDGKQFAITRESNIRDVVLVRNITGN